jgi:AcrR family transcriptional regulator
MSPPKVISEEEFINREQELIELARSLTVKDCLTTLTIDKLVDACPYSKGTIYKHFVSKEDLLMAICNTCIQEIKLLFTRALTFDGNSREKMTAVLVSYLIWAKLHPAQLFAVLSAHSPSVVKCASEERNELHQYYESQLMALLTSEIDKAVQAGDLTLPSQMVYEQVTFSMWSASWGAMALIMSRGNSKQLEPMVFERESFTNAHLILDGFNWKPLYKDWDYSKTIQRVAKEIFSAEMMLLEERGSAFVFT